MANIKAVFDAATLADAVQKAARVAPTKGAAFDKAAGIYFEGRAAQEWAVIKSSNLDTTYLHKIKHVDTPPGTDYKWRIPSTLLSGLVSQFPMAQGSRVNFIDTGDGAIRITSGSVKVKLSLIQGEFVRVDEFHTHHFGEAHDFAQKAAQVSWACDKASKGALSGVYIDGESLIACDSQVAAIVPCKVPINKPVVVPLWNISGVLKSASDVRLSASEKELQISLDSESQATSRLIEGAYPEVKTLIRDDFTGVARLPKSQVVEAINRMLVVAHAERLPTIKLSFNSGLVKTLTLDIDVPDTGRIQDTVPINGDYEDSFDIWFTPNALTQAIDNGKSEVVEMHFGHVDKANAHLKACVIKDDKGYMAVVMPRRP